MTAASRSSSLAVVGLPGPRPVLGPWLHLVRTSRDPLGEIGQRFARFGPLVGLVGGDLRAVPAVARWVFVHGPELGAEVVGAPEVFRKPPLSKQLFRRGPPASDREAAGRRWGAGLFGIDGDEHRRQRRMMMPAFHRARIEAACAEIGALAAAEVDRWRVDDVRDVRGDMAVLTLRVAARCLLGERLGVADGAAMSPRIRQTLRLLIRPSVFVAPFDLPGLPYRQFLDAAVDAERTVRAVIAARRAAGAEGGDVLSTLLHARDEAGEPLSEDQLVEHAGVMLLAGHETSSNALTWTLFLLSQHPTVAAALGDELAGTLRGDAPTLAQLSQLPLLDRVVKESLRVLPPVPLNARVVGADTTLRGHFLPAGTNLLMSAYHTHHMPDLFFAPGRFDPGRWEGREPGPHAYVPFGAGPRTCIGAAFAQAEIKTILAVILQRYRPAFVPRGRVDRLASITLSPRHPLWMRLQPARGATDAGVGEVRGDVRELVELPS